MNINIVGGLFLSALALTSCSKVSGQTGTAEGITESFPKLGTYYMYVDGSLVASFEDLTRPNAPYHAELFGGIVTPPSDAKAGQSTLKGGSVIFRRNKDNVEVARLTSDTIVWYGPTVKHQPPG